jgi:hypothetical protein
MRAHRIGPSDANLFLSSQARTHAPRRRTPAAHFLESQVEGNKEVVAALREENLIIRIDDSTGEITALAEIALTRIDELREILHRLEGKIDALTASLNSDRATRSEIGNSIRSCATSTNP